MAIAILGYGAACSIGTIPAYVVSILLSLLSIFVSGSFSIFNQGGSIKEIYKSLDKIKDKYIKRIDNINASLKEDPNNKDFKEDLKNSKKVIDLCNKTMQAVKSNRRKMTQQIAGSLFRNTEDD